MDLGDGLGMRRLVVGDAALVVEATGGESAPALWGPRPAGPYSMDEARDALAEWDREGHVSLGVLRDATLLGAVGVMPDRPGSAELAYWVRPEARRRGVATRAVRAATRWAHETLALPRIWLEINPTNEASLRLAERAGFGYEERLTRHCREWTDDDPDRDAWHDCLIWAHTEDR